MLPFITLDGLSFQAADARPLFENLTLGFGRDRTGLVGRNGAGKSTLLRLIAGEIAPTAGAVTTRGRIATLRQSFAQPPDVTLADMLGVAEALAALDRIERGRPHPNDLADADWDLPAAIEAVLARVGLTGVELERPAWTLSGGQATRAALGKLLIAQPDVILLDEPTNNLDAIGRALVADLLSDWEGGAIGASHDRALLRRVDRIVEFGGLGVKVYGGGWDVYAQRRSTEADAATENLDATVSEARRVERALQTGRDRKQRRDAEGRRSRARGDQPRILMNPRAERAEVTGGRQARLAERLRERARESLEAAKSRIEQVRALSFELPPSRLDGAKLVLAFEEVAFAWPSGAPVLSGVNLRIVGPSRVAVTGANASGKTTLVRLARGELKPSRGRVMRGVEAVMLDQKAALLHDDQSLMANFRRLNPEASDNDAHAALARFLFRNVQALRPASELSGGERLRAALACVLMTTRPPRLIIVDEPTNHLDLESLAAVEAALAAYDGAVLAVSHDDDFLAAIGASERLELG
jgi:ATPase subunit of ABC transporter with duplicated ATPase domains